MTADDSLPGVDAREEERQARCVCPVCEGDGWLFNDMVEDDWSACHECGTTGVVSPPPAPLVDRDTGDEG